MKFATLLMPSSVYMSRTPFSKIPQWAQWSQKNWKYNLHYDDVHGSAFASAQSNQNLHCPHEESLQSWLSKMRPVKILIRMHEYADWSESSLGARLGRCVYWRSGSTYMMDLRYKYLRHYVYFVQLQNLFNGNTSGRTESNFRSLADEINRNTGKET